MKLGFSDRILGIASGFTASILTGRLFYVGSRKGILSLQAIFDSYVVTDIFSNKYDQEWMINPLRDNARVIQYNQSILASRRFFAANAIRNSSLTDCYKKGDFSTLS